MIKLKAQVTCDHWDADVKKNCTNNTEVNLIVGEKKVVTKTGITITGETLMPTLEVESVPSGWRIVELHGSTYCPKHST